MDEWLFWEQYSHEPYIAVCRFQMGFLGKPPPNARSRTGAAGRGGAGADGAASRDRRSIWSARIFRSPTSRCWLIPASRTRRFRSAHHAAFGGGSRCEAALRIALGQLQRRRSGDDRDRCADALHRARSRSTMSRSPRRTAPKFRGARRRLQGAPSSSPTCKPVGADRTHAAAKRDRGRAALPTPHRSRIAPQQISDESRGSEKGRATHVLTACPDTRAPIHLQMYRLE